MTSFNRIGTSALYSADSNTASGGWGFAITRTLPDGQELPVRPITLSDALANLTWQGTFIYVAAGAFPGSDGNPQPFLDKLTTFIQNASVSGQGAILFLPDGSGDDLDSATLKTYVLLNRSSRKITLSGPGLTVALTDVDGIQLQIDPNAQLSVPPEGDRIDLDLDNTPVAKLEGTFKPAVKAPPTNGAQLHVGGSSSGALSFSLIIVQSSLYTRTNWGFQFLIPNQSRGARTLPNESDRARKGGSTPLDFVAAWLPFADRGPPNAVLGFTAQVNLVNPRNRIKDATRTVLLFDGTGDDTALPSFYRTNYGKQVALTPVTDGSGEPAGLVINDGYVATPQQNGFRLAPVGDFVMAIPGAEPNGPYKLLCGLSGTETIDFLPEVAGKQHGTRLRFVANQPANIPQFPLQAASPTGPPIEAKLHLFDDRFETSWVSVVPPPTVVPLRTDEQPLAHYAAAPKGAELFGEGTAAPEGLLGPKDPGVGVPATVAFPMLPFAGFTSQNGVQDASADQLEQVAREIVSPTRKAEIAHSKETMTASSEHMSLFATTAADGDGDALVSTTTPTGFITRYGESDGRWKQLLLAQVAGGSGVTRQMGFTGLDGELQSAFQTSDQFLVIVNNEHLGPFVPDSSPLWFMPPAPPPPVMTSGFYNTINIGDWNFASNTGCANAYGDYHSVIIVKGVKGKLLDVDPVSGEASPTSLVRSPDKWTMRDVFASPDPYDTSQLGAVSNWLVDYCLSAYQKRDDPYFQNFAKIIQDPNWTGVLILKATVKDVPTELAGILAGVNNRTDFYAHHVGIEIGQIDGKNVQQTDTTSMFGLIYYIDPEYDDSQEPHTIAPRDPSAPYDFTLLTLKALFENSAVKKFDSLAQMVLNRIFGSAVTEMVDLKRDGPQANLYNAVLLKGGVQRNGDAVVYSLASAWPNRYSLANNVLQSVEVDTAQMSTRDDGSQSGKTVSWIAMSGFMNFGIIPAVHHDDPPEDLPAFDIFSFGSPDPNHPGLRQGLSFDGLGLSITIPANDPEHPVLALVESEIAFNTSASQSRDESIFNSFQLELLGLLSGNANAAEGGEKSDPASLGYLPAVTQYNLRGVTSGAGGWHGMNFKLNLGTPGALAGKVNLDSSLLVAWADDSGASEGFAAFVGVELPGAGTGGDLFSLQTVIKLSVGLIQLMYVPPSAGGDGKTGKGGFLLVLNEIALKLLGLLKIPPSGNTAFLLFGDPEAADLAGLGWLAVYNQAKKKPAESGAKRELAELTGS
jgi:hypothetical protein